jgi:hypothetical protein
VFDAQVSMEMQVQGCASYQSMTQSRCRVSADIRKCGVSEDWRAYNYTYV